MKTLWTCQTQNSRHYIETQLQYVVCYNATSATTQSYGLFVLPLVGTTSLVITRLIWLCSHIFRLCDVALTVFSKYHDITRPQQTRTWHVFCLFLRVSSEYVQPITGQVTDVTCPVIGRAQPDLPPSKKQITGTDRELCAFSHTLFIPHLLDSDINVMNATRNITHMCSMVQILMRWRRTGSTYSVSPVQR